MSFIIVVDSASLCLSKKGGSREWVMKNHLGRPAMSGAGASLFFLPLSSPMFLPISLGRRREQRSLEGAALSRLLSAHHSKPFVGINVSSSQSLLLQAGRSSKITAFSKSIVIFSLSKKSCASFCHLNIL